MALAACYVRAEVSGTDALAVVARRKMARKKDGCPSRQYASMLKNCVTGCDHVTEPTVTSTQLVLWPIAARIKHGPLSPFRL